MRRTDLRSRSERRTRRSWRRGAGPILRLASALFGLAADLRNLAYDAGLAGRVGGDVPVLSVGGLTVGGSGKTPVAAQAARWVRAAGGRPAVVTSGFSDEVEVHRTLGGTDVPVVGERNRGRGARRAAGHGADLVVLDDGFQHRRLARDLEWVVVAEDRLAADGWSRLPAGPARDRWSELRRADAVILTRRASRSDGAGPRSATSAAAGIDRQFPAAAVARCELRPGPLRPVNARAADGGEPRPSVSFASIMKGEEFLHALRSRRPGIRREFLFPDHHPVSDRRLEEMVQAAGDRGLVGTRKDVVKIRGRVDERTPLWMATESLSWSGGGAVLERQVTRLGGGE